MLSGYKIPGTEYVLPSLTADQAIGFEDRGYYKRLESNDTHPSVRALIMREMIHAALAQNHPEVTADQVGAILDSGVNSYLYLIATGMPAMRVEEIKAKAREDAGNPPPAV